MYTLRHYIFWLCPTNSSKNYKHNTADNDTRIKTRNVTTKIFAVYATQHKSVTLVGGDEGDRAVAVNGAPFIKPMF